MFLLLVLEKWYHCKSIDLSNIQPTSNQGCDSNQAEQDQQKTRKKIKKMGDCLAFMVGREIPKGTRGVTHWLFKTKNQLIIRCTQMKKKTRRTQFLQCIKDFKASNDRKAAQAEKKEKW